MNMSLLSDQKKPSFDRQENKQGAEMGNAHFGQGGKEGFFEEITLQMMRSYSIKGGGKCIPR